MSGIENRILVIGNPLLDISAHVPIDLLNKYGLLPSNAILAEEKHLPLYDELVQNYQVQYIAGGSGQNTIRAAQWMLGQRKNAGKSAYIGSIGKDAYGQKLKEEATNDGVTVYYQEVDSTPTGTCAVLITSDKDRSMVANLAAANLYKIDHFNTEAVQSVVQKTSLFYLTGYFLTVSPDTALAVGKHVGANPQKTLLMNLSAPFIIDFFFDRFEAVFPYVDYVFGNEQEFTTLGKKFSWGENLVEIGLQFAKQPKVNNDRKRTVIITQGAHKTIVIRSDGEVSEFEPIKVRPEQIVDTNGAGDSFVGGFLAALALNKPIETAIAAAHFCASVTIQTSGTVFRGKTNNFFGDDQ